jgi:hypothetical protein
MEQDEEIKKMIELQNKNLNEISVYIENQKLLYVLREVYKENKLLIDSIIDNLDEIKENYEKI